MTNPVIESVQLALGRAGRALTGPRPAIYPARRGAGRDAEIDVFMEEIGKLSGSGKRVAASGIKDELKNLVREQTVRRAALWATPGLQSLQIARFLHALDVEVVSVAAGKQELARCDLGVTEVDFLLPETGTIALLSSALKPRAVSLLPRVHLAIATPAALRADLHQVFAEAKASPYLVFITGPSRTADIELTTTLGVHGPKSLYVWMMEG